MSMANLCTLTQNIKSESYTGSVGLFSCTHAKRLASSPATFFSLRAPQCLRWHYVHSTILYGRDAAPSRFHRDVADTGARSGHEAAGPGVAVAGARCGHEAAGPR